MPVAIIFQMQMALGYAAWLIWLVGYGLPWVRRTDPATVHRAIATLHGFRFFGLVFIVPGVVGPALPGGFAAYAAYGDFATGLLALAALASFGSRPLFRAFVVAFNIVGICDLVGDYYHAVRLGLPEVAGQLGATYVIPVLYVPLLMITHILAFYLLFRRTQARRSHA